MIKQLQKVYFSTSTGGGGGDSVRYLTHKTLRTKLKQLKKFDSQARVMGLDVGRKYTGIGLSCKELVLARGYKTLMMPTSAQLGRAQTHDFTGLCQSLRNIIKNKHIKGIVVGYPLKEDGSPAGRHNRFIEDFLMSLASERVFRNIPVTLVNEYDSSMEAKAQIFKQLSESTSSTEDLMSLV